MAQTEPDHSTKTVWTTRLTLWSFRLTLFSLAVPAVGLTLARFDVIAKLAGFSALLGGGLISALALIFGILGLVAGRKATNPAWGRGIASVAISFAYVGFLATRPLVAGDAPAIHDITTDLANPPQFEVLPLRSDNLAGVDTMENWRKIHAEAYGDLTAITLSKPVAEATADVVRLARQSGWQIASSDPARGRVEATASVSYIRFKDDVVIRIVPIEDGRHSRIDMRSVSRVGVSDLGVNARRIRDFLEALAAE